MIVHLALAHEWEAAVASGGPYERSTVGRSLAEEGFIHCCTGDQLAATVQRHLHGRDDVLALVLDPARVDDLLRFEDLHDAGEAFPHLYGPLPLDAVVEVVPLGAGTDAGTGSTTGDR